MHFHLVGRYELADAGNGAHLALFGHAGQALGELADHFLLVAAQSIEHDLWRAEADAVIGGLGGFVYHRGGMQQGSGWNAAAVEYDPHERGIARSEARQVGKEWASECRSRWERY